MNLAVAGVGVILVVVAGVVLVSAYRRVGPGQALLIVGYGGARVVTEGGTFVWPMVQAAWVLPLESWSVAAAAPDTLATPMPSLLTADGAGVRVGAEVRVRIVPEVGPLRGKGGLFLTAPAEQREAVLRQAVAGELARVAAAATVAELVDRPEEVAARVGAGLAAELGRLGLVVEGVTLREVAFEGEARTIAAGY